MLKNRPITPGDYPTVYRCILCRRDLKKKDIWTTKAIQLDETTCVCEPCVPTWERKQSKPLRDFLTKPEVRNTFISQSLINWRDRRARRRRQITVAEAETHLVDFVDASLGDQAMRKQLYAIATMDPFHRESLLNTIIAESEMKGAPKELLLVLHHLKKSEFVGKLKELLESR